MPAIGNLTYKRRFLPLAGVTTQIYKAAIVCVKMQSKYPLINNDRTTAK